MFNRPGSLHASVAPGWCPQTVLMVEMHLGILSDKGFVSLLILNNCPLGKELYRETFLHEEE